MITLVGRITGLLKEVSFSEMELYCYCEASDDSIRAIGTVDGNEVTFELPKPVSGKCVFTVPELKNEEWSIYIPMDAWKVNAIVGMDVQVLLDDEPQSGKRFRFFIRKDQDSTIDLRYYKTDENGLLALESDFFTFTPEDTISELCCKTDMEKIANNPFCKCLSEIAADMEGWQWTVRFRKELQNVDQESMDRQKRVCDTLSFYLRDVDNNCLPSVDLLLCFQASDSTISIESNESGLIKLDISNLRGAETSIMQYRPADSESLFFRVWDVKPLTKVKKDSVICLTDYKDVPLMVDLVDLLDYFVEEEMQMRFWIKRLGGKELVWFRTVRNDSRKITLIIPKEHIMVNEEMSNYLYCEPESGTWPDGQKYPKRITLWDGITSCNTGDHTWRLRLRSPIE